ncbi:MAG: hypothetical protein QNL04_00905 [SAR324 cluster bacterium]|nr:hypothetical protein [SAR324 cluster bacterium]
MVNPTKKEIEEQAAQAAKILDILKKRASSFASRAYAELNQGGEKRLMQKKRQLEIAAYAKELAKIKEEIQRKTGKSTEDPE